MLILTRRRHERIIINDSIVINVESYGKTYVKLSVDTYIPASTILTQRVAKENLFKRIQNRFKPIA